MDLMRSRWGKEDLLRIERGTLLFTTALATARKEDFEAVVHGSGVNSELRKERQDWIEALKKGENPAQVRKFAAYQDRQVRAQGAVLEGSYFLSFCRGPQYTCKPLEALGEYREAQRLSPLTPIRIHSMALSPSRKRNWSG